MEILIGTALGFLSGLGIGGGSLLMLYLTTCLSLDPQTARAINLLFYLPCAIVSAGFSWKRGVISLKTIFPAIFTGCLSGILFSWLGADLSPGLLRKGFGLLLILAGLRELIWQGRALSSSSGKPDSPPK